VNTLFNKKQKDKARQSLKLTCSNKLKKETECFL